MNYCLADQLRSCLFRSAFAFMLILFLGRGTVLGQESVLDSIENLSLYESSELVSSLLFLVFVISLGWLIWTLKHGTRKRRSFTAETRRQVLRNQNFKCGFCKINVGVWDYHHKDGNRANNNTSNCQALCPNCHAKRSRGLIQLETKSKGKNISLGVGLGIMLIMILYSFT
jgi:hypothetical protein